MSARRRSSGAPVAAVLGAAVLLSGCGAKHAPVTFTVGDLRAMHADVVVKGHEVKGFARLTDGDDVKTGPDGRARVRLDDGTLVVVDASTSFTLHGTSVALAEGRVFVQGEGARFREG